MARPSLERPIPVPTYLAAPSAPASTRTARRRDAVRAEAWLHGCSDGCADRQTSVGMAFLDHRLVLKGTLIRPLKAAPHETLLALGVSEGGIVKAASVYLRE